MSHFFIKSLSFFFVTLAGSNFETMKNKSFKFYNNLVGWIVFAIAAFTYLSTIEPTASFWDCGEFLATSYKLEIGHPPGAPFFMLMQKFFSLFAPSPELVPKLVNSMSALASAFTILFLFWTITYLAKKIILRNKEELTTGNIIAILGSGVVGALAYTFTDSFWFSAVEAEVYASSSFLTALVFWLILKWEAIADEKYSNRLLILISYIIGLSIGVHLLNLLTVPAIVFVYYFRKYKPTTKGVIITFFLSIIILGAIMYVIIPGILIVASWFELFFVNVFGLPYHSGVIIYLITLAALIVWSLRYTYKKRKALWHTAILMTTMLIIGYSSFILIVIRSNANPPLDENNPEDVFSLLSYLNREQYGDRPLIYGQYYNAPLDPEEPYIQGSPIYDKKDGKYVVVGYKQKPNYDSRFCTFFPRMWSPQANHVREYKSWAKIKGTPIRVGDKVLYKPTFGENLRFFFVYQLGHMYFRYFMWNFSGRQNDWQGHGSLLRGNWITGIPFIDKILVGPQKGLPYKMRTNKARNTYYMLPFLLGLIGLLYHWKKHKEDFSVVLLLFFYTGIAIVIYLNQYPLQPRERDYAYVGSFYAYAIWIGLGVLAIYEFARKYLKNPALTASLATIITLLAVPTIMAHENWDDHDRSGRYTARDFAKNYLMSCDKNSILFTNGDNDTFPLWYVQEVEGFRTDVKIVNLSLFNTDWYIDQMKRKTYEADPIPNSFTHEQYAHDTRDLTPIFEITKDYVNLKEAINFVKSNNPKAKVELQSGDQVNYMPTRHFILKVYKENAKKAGTVNPNMPDSLIPNEIKFSLPKNKNYIIKGELMVLDMLAQNNWKRPIYYAVTVSSDNYLNLQNYFSVEGLAYRITPFKTNGASPLGYGTVNTEKMYDNLVNKFVWGGINNPDVYLDENNMRMTMNFRANFDRLANALIQEGKKDKAKKALDRCLEVTPDKTVPYDIFSLQMASLYLQLGEDSTAVQIMKTMKERTEEELNYYAQFNNEQKKNIKNDIRTSMGIYQEIFRIANMFKKKEITKDMENKLMSYYQIFASIQ